MSLAKAQRGRRAGGGSAQLGRAVHWEGLSAMSHLI